MMLDVGGRWLRRLSVISLVLGLHALAFWQLSTQSTAQPARAPLTASTIHVHLFTPAPPVPVPAPPAVAPAPPPVLPPAIPPNPELAIKSPPPVKSEIPVKKALKPTKKLEKAPAKIARTKPIVAEKPTPAIRQKPPEPLSKRVETPTPAPMSPALPIIPPSSPVITATSPSTATMPAPVKQTAPRFDAAYLRNPKPVYPLVSKKLNEQGIVYLKVKVNSAGHTEQVLLEKSSGFERLDQAGLAAVQQWQFIPAREGETPISAWVVVPMEFVLKNR